MVRFSLSPRNGTNNNNDETDLFQAWRELDELESSSSSSSSCTSSASSDESDNDEEPPHPLGFYPPSHGKTRFFVDRPHESIHNIRQRLGYRSHYYNNNNNNKDLWTDDFVWTQQAQVFPPLDAYLDRRTAPTVSLLRTSPQHHDKNHDDDDDAVDRVTQLLQAASVVDTPSVPLLQEGGVRLLELADVANRELREIRRTMIQEQIAMDQRHLQAADALKMLLKQQQEEAARVIKQEQEERKKRNKAEQLLREEQDAEEAERGRVQEEKRQRDLQQEEKERAQAQKLQDERKARRLAAEKEEAKKTEYILKAKRLVAKLVELRQSVEPFEKAKEVSKRRLHMKKTVKGKVNTLNPDPNKIQSVASEVALEISQARDEDDQNKQQVQAGNTQITSAMTKGKRYLVDLLASTAMVRCQAEGFNGTRGDGFPLASMLALVSTEAKELVPVLGAHIYTVCPTAIPTLPHPSKHSTEEELMEGLGMARDTKTGEYESFDRFLSRTEGIISLVAEIMASKPDSHVLLGGHKSSIEWLQRFLVLLPAPPQTLPLLTAPVLDAFLSGAGHMMARLFPDEFKMHLDVITKDTIHRLDVGPIGEPRALRLRKSVQRGFDFFKNTLPSKAVPSLYLGAHADGEGGSTISLKTPRTQQAAPTPFGTTQDAAPSQVTASAANPFGAPASTTLGETVPSATPFGKNQGSSSGFPTASASTFGAPAPAPATPFGSVQGPSSGASASSSSLFGVPASQQGGSIFGTATDASPFAQAGQANNTMTPFGSSYMSASRGDDNMAISQAGPVGTNTFPSAFGAPSSAPSPFGVSSSTFREKSGQMGSDAFGTSSGINPSPFGASTGGSTTGAFGPQNPQPSPFGGGQQSTAPFGQQSSAAFGSPFGSGQQAVTPFGQSSSTPFGSNNNVSSFGGSGSSVSPFGITGEKQGRQQHGNRGPQKPPCKFFARGNCRYGSNCRFSHETAQSSQGGFAPDPFGGPRR